MPCCMLCTCVCECMCNEKQMQVEHTHRRAGKHGRTLATMYFGVLTVANTHSLHTKQLVDDARAWQDGRRPRRAVGRSAVRPVECVRVSFGMASTHRCCPVVSVCSTFECMPNRQTRARAVATILGRLRELGAAPGLAVEQFASATFRLQAMANNDEPARLCVCVGTAATRCHWNVHILYLTVWQREHFAVN